MLLALYALSGAVAGLAYAGLLAWNSRLYLSATATSWAVLLHVARTLAVVAALVGLALAGARAFVAALVAFACAHAVGVLAVRRRV